MTRALRTAFLSLALALSSAACDGEREPSGSGPPDAGPLDAGLDASADIDGGVDAGPLHPLTLSDTGLYRDGVDGPLADGILPYEVRSPLWTDGASKRRFLLLPAGTTIDTSDADGWRFPVGTRVFKEFSVEGRVIETRMLWKIDEGEWVRVSYLQRADGSDADAVPEGAPDALGTSHDVPDQGACFNCHRGVADFVIGVSAMQLDRTSFDAWVAAGVLPDDTEWGETPGDETQRAALGYLNANCGHCHSDRHPLAALRTLRLFLPVGLDDPLEAPAWLTSAGLDAHHELDGVLTIVEPGNPASSQLYRRMGVRDETAMPPVGTERVDETGRALVERWILEAPAP